MGLHLNPTTGKFDLVSNSGGGGGGSWGSITGTLSNQTDLQNALDLKADTSSLSTVATTGDHTDLSNIGTNTHAQIDTHIADTTNPHSVTYTQVGADPAGTDNSTDVTLAGTPDYLTLSGQEITLGQIDLANDVTGLLPLSNVEDINTTYLEIDGSNANTTIDIQGEDLVNVGGLGIGTTNLGTAKLAVAGTSNTTLKIVGGATSNPAFEFWQDTTQKAYFQYIDSGDYFRIVDNGVVGFAQKSGKIGIGTTSPSEKLEIVGNVSILDNAAVSLGVTRYTNNSYSPILKLQKSRGTDASPLGVLEGDSIFRIQAVGRVDASNWGKLDNNGNVITSTATEDYSLTTQGRNLQFSTIKNGTDSGLVRLTISDYGGVGIGTTEPSAKLHISGESNEVQQIIQANTTQTANLTEWQNSSGVALSGVDERGILFSKGKTSDAQSVLFIGNNAGNVDSTGNYNVAIGSSSGKDLTTGVQNMLLGYATGSNVTSGSSNLAIGYASMLLATTASGNVAIGSSTLRNITTTGDNVAIGSSSGFNTTGTGNTFIGESTGLSVTTGNYNVLIGNSAGSQLTTESNKLYIANSSTTTPLIYGEFDNELVGINGTFEVNGKELLPEDDFLSYGDSKVLNYNGYLEDNTNFSDFDYDAVNVPAGAVGSFSKTGWGVHLSDEFTLVNPSLVYYYGVDAANFTNASQRCYVGHACYDIDELAITAQFYMYRTNGTTAVLSRDFTYGDSHMYFSGDPDWDSLLTSPHVYQRGVIAWNYENSKGYTYLPRTYSRNASFNIFAQNAVATDIGGGEWSIPCNTTGYTNYGASTIPSGTELDVSSSGGTYDYSILSNSVLGAVGEWNTYSTIIGGVTTGGVSSPNNFRPGTAKIKNLFLLNYNSNPNTDVQKFSNIQLRPTSSTYQVENANGTVTNIAGLQASNSYGAGLYDQNQNGIYVADGGDVGIGTTYSNGKLQVNPESDRVGIVVRGATGQTANLAQWQVVGGVKATLDADGIFKPSGYESSDGSTGATGTFEDNNGNTVTVKDGLITDFGV